MLYDDVVESQLHVGALNDALLDRVLGDEADDVHLLLLPDTMRAILQQTRHVTYMYSVQLLLLR